MGVSQEIIFKRENSLPTLIERDIERRIISGEFKPGSRLNENELSTQLGVSRGPIREACRKLEQAGLLTIIVNRGVFVRTITNEEILEVREIRSALSQVAARRITANITEAQIEAIDQCLYEMDKAIDAKDNNTYFLLNLKFHQMILETSGMTRVVQMYTALDKELSLTRRQSLVEEDAMRASNNEHRVIANALRLRDDRALGAAFASHSINSRARHMQTLAAQSTATTTRPDPKKGRKST